mmetsp:Transcript_94435/g.271992  ORF Transcript_94435/g.271992 Transcript_94435/m.271992 type:complete len:205 (+) Transcript_94435:461-1075(+)
MGHLGLHRMLPGRCGERGRLGPPRCTCKAAGVFDRRPAERLPNLEHAAGHQAGVGPCQSGRRHSALHRPYPRCACGVRVWRLAACHQRPCLREARTADDATGRRSLGPGPGERPFAAQRPEGFAARDVGLRWTHPRQRREYPRQRPLRGEIGTLCRPRPCCPAEAEGSTQTTRSPHPERRRRASGREAYGSGGAWLHRACSGQA